MRRTDCTRRFLLQGLGAVAACGLPLGAAEDPWDAVPGILARIHAPVFPSRVFDVRKYAADPEGRKDSRPAFQSAIESCSRAGGGTVLAPRGVYLSNGPLHLKSNVRLDIEEGAVLRFGADPADYLPAVLVRWEGTRCYNYSPLLYAAGQEHIAITGGGTIDGQTTLFWHEWKHKQAADQAALRGMGAQRSSLKQRVFGKDHFLRPELIQFYDCRDVLIEGVTLQGSPFWTVHPVFCANVTIREVQIHPGTTNDDGVDPDSCADVLIERCAFETKDDNIAIKAGRDQDAWGGRPCENIIIRGCTFTRSDTSGICIGSEMSGNVRNVFLENDRLLKVGNALYIKSNSDCGGIVENVVAHDLTVADCDTFLRLETDYKRVTGHPYPPAYRNIEIDNSKCRVASAYGIYSAGIAGHPIRGVALHNVNIEQAATAEKVVYTEGLTLENVWINGRPAGAQRAR